MKLGNWLAQKGMKQRKFADLVGANPGLVSRWITGQIRPSPPYLRAIEQITRKMVSFADFDWPERTRDD